MAAGFEHEPGCHVARIRVTEQPPLRLSVMVGDVVHNLRSSLDLVAWQLALDHVGEDEANEKRNNITFPIADTPNGFRRHRSLPYFSDDALAVLDYMQPYKRRHIGADEPVEAEPLAVLHELSIADKHRVLHAAFTQLDVSDTRFRPRAIYIEDAGAQVEVTIKRGDTFEDGTQVALIRFPGHGPPESTGVDVTRQPTAVLRFGPGVPVAALWTLCAHTGWVVGNCRAALLI